MYNNLESTRSFNQDYALKPRITRININKNNEMHLILCGSKCFSVIFAILLMLFEFIRVIRGLTHYLSLINPDSPFASD